jgi:hypothetical protein
LCWILYWWDYLQQALLNAESYSNDQRPTTNDQRPTTNDQRPTTNDQRQILSLRQDLLRHISVHIGEAEVASGVTVGQSFVINP